MKGLTKQEDYQLRSVGVTQAAGDGLKEINHRFRSAGVGYQFEAGRIIRVDS
jgi:hypothetical protein